LLRVCHGVLFAARFGTGVQPRLTLGEENHTCRRPTSARGAVANIGERLRWLTLQTDPLQRPICEKPEGLAVRGPERPECALSSRQDSGLGRVERTHPELRAPGIASSRNDAEVLAA